MFLKKSEIVGVARGGVMRITLIWLLVAKLALLREVAVWKSRVAGHA